MSEKNMVRKLPLFTPVENAIIDDERVSSKGLLIYLALARFASREERCCWPSVETIAQKARLKHSATIEGLKELKALGYIQAVRRRNRTDGGAMSNLYIIGIPDRPAEEKPKPEEPESVKQTQGREGKSAEQGGVSPPNGFTGGRSTDSNYIQYITRTNEQEKAGRSPAWTEGPPAFSPPETPKRNGVGTLLGEYSSLHQGKTRAKPVIGPKEAGQAETLLKKTDLDTALKKLRRYYSKQYWFSKDDCRSLGQFVRHYDEISLAEPVNGSLTPGGEMSDTLKRALAERMPPLPPLRGT
jgi:hypothetical protein